MRSHAAVCSLSLNSHHQGRWYAMLWEEYHIYESACRGKKWEKVEEKKLSHFSKKKTWSSSRDLFDLKCLAKVFLLISFFFMYASVKFYVQVENSLIQIYEQRSKFELLFMVKSFNFKNLKKIIKLILRPYEINQFICSAIAVFIC